ncbi:PLP-dependent transferase [Xylaria arbuscula]|nr:PLP-dependent transferase [Xylaria arbuscula]
MGCNILSRKNPITNFSAIFFSAQKNLGSTGIAMLIIQKQFLPKPSSKDSRSYLKRKLNSFTGPLRPLRPILRPHRNICFTIKGGDAVEETFLKNAATVGLTGLKGYRELKGIRASNYNSISLEGAEKLANFISSFASQSGTSLVE